MSSRPPQDHRTTYLIFAFAASLLVFGVLATQVGMPLRLVFVALAVSDLIMLVLIFVGKKIPPGSFGRKNDNEER